MKHTERWLNIGLGEVREGFLEEGMFILQEFTGKESEEMRETFL